MFKELMDLVKGDVEKLKDVLADQGKTKEEIDSLVEAMRDAGLLKP